MIAPNSSGWRKSLTGAAFTLLVSAFALYMAMRLVEAVLPMLIAISVAMVIVYMTWIIYHRRQGW